MKAKIILCSLLCVLSVASSYAAKKEKAPKKDPQAPVKVASYNLCTSDSRVKSLKKGKFVSEQQLYCNSYVALAAIINDINPDLIGLQEICDSIWGNKGNIGLCDEIARQKGGKEEYEWILFPNTSKGRISYDDAIGVKKDRFKVVDSDIFWMGGYPDEPKAIEGRKGCSRPCVWAKLKDKVTGKELYFVSVHLVLESVCKTPGGNLFNAQNCISHLDDVIIPKGAASIIVGDFNCDNGAEAFKAMTSRRWVDTYLQLKSENRVEENELMAGTQPKKDETGFGKWRPDHILYYKMVPNWFHIDRRKFPTVDGTEHFPSDHLPIVAEFKYE